MLRPEDYLCTPPAIAPAPLTALLTLSRLRPGAVRFLREAPLPRGKTSSVVRASSPQMQEAAAGRMPSLAHREVALALSEEVDARLGAQLLPSAVPADVAEFRNGAGTAVGTLDVRRGVSASSVVSLPLHSA
jgi:red chlorophyll catabolite reductase